MSSRSNKPETTGAKLRVTLIKSPTKYPERQKHVDGPVARGMIAKVAHLVSVEEVK
jgi:ribosomal protein L30/L7E